MVKIVVDGFGGDNAPEEIVKGVVSAVKHNEDISIILTGKTEVLESELAKYKYDVERINIVDAREIITNDESPTVAIKTKKDSSLVKAFDIVNSDDKIAGLISAGSTGAVLTGGFLKFGRIKGVFRPALCPVFSTFAGTNVCICDSGANMDCKPEYIEQFAVMASEYLKILGTKKPRVALLNVGTEDHKGDQRTKETFELIKANKHVNFVGNMEARDLLSGNYDIVVTDGFAGNVLLKSTEGTLKGVLKLLKSEIKNSPMAAIGAVFMRKVFKNIKNKFDYKKQGGAVLLGCKKLLMKAHGSSNATSIEVCINQLYTLSKGHLVSTITKSFEKLGNESDGA